MDVGDDVGDGDDESGCALRRCRMMLMKMMMMTLTVMITITVCVTIRRWMMKMLGHD